MKYAIAFATLAAAARAELLGLDADLKLPLGIELPISLHLGPDGPPPEDCINVWHPPHHGVDIDDCDNDGADSWHYVHPGHPNHPEQGHYIWTTQTMPGTASHTIYSCPTDTPNCGDHEAYVTTVAVPESTTICPVPAPPGYEAPSSAYYVPTMTQVYEQPTGHASYAPPAGESTMPYQVPNTYVHYAQTTPCPEVGYTAPATWQTHYKPPTAVPEASTSCPPEVVYTHPVQPSSVWYPPAGTPPPVWTKPSPPPAGYQSVPYSHPSGNQCPGPNCPPAPPATAVIPVVPVQYSPVPAETPSYVVASSAVRNAGGLFAILAFVALL
ncbi:hypothetical protein BGZ63DRAFT_421272 [Mariannaea sp. PMI_226]|nr:hypothetical protein BGZ63DRAFT_421272 [Mariannaea sp. PMI_226]